MAKVTAKQFLHLVVAFGRHPETLVGSSCARNKDVDDLEEAIYDSMFEEVVKGSALRLGGCNVDATHETETGSDFGRGNVASQIDAEAQELGTTVVPQKEFFSVEVLEDWSARWSNVLRVILLFLMLA